MPKYPPKFRDLVNLIDQQRRNPEAVDINLLAKAVTSFRLECTQIDEARKNGMGAELKEKDNEPNEEDISVQMKLELFKQFPSRHMFRDPPKQRHMMNLLEQHKKNPFCVDPAEIVQAVKSFRSEFLELMGPEARKKYESKRQNGLGAEPEEKDNEPDEMSMNDIKMKLELLTKSFEDYKEVSIKKMDDLNNQIGQLQNRELQEENKKLKLQIAEIYMKNKNNDDENDKKDEKIKKLEEDNQIVTEERDCFWHQLRISAANLSILKKKLQACQIEMEEKDQKIKDFENLEEELEMLKKENEEKNQKIKNLEEEKLRTEDMSLEIQQLQQELAESQYSEETYQIEAEEKDQKINSLEEKVSKMNEEHQWKFQKVIDAVGEKIKQLESMEVQLEKRNEDICKLNEDLEQKNIHVAELEKQLEALQCESSDAEEYYNIFRRALGIKDQAIYKLDMTLKNMQQELKEANDTVESKQKTVLHLERSVYLYQKDIEALEKKVAQLKDKCMI